MSSDSFTSASTIFDAIEADFESSRTLNNELVVKFFDELQKFENGSAAIKEFTWLLGVGEADRHTVEAKECKKVYLIDFKKCRKFLNIFMTQQD